MRPSSSSFQASLGSEQLCLTASLRLAVKTNLPIDLIPSPTLAFYTELS